MLTHWSPEHVSIIFKNMILKLIIHNNTLDIRWKIVLVNATEPHW